MALGETAAHPFWLLINRKNVSILPANTYSPSTWLQIALSGLQGKPQKINLYQANAEGFIGPFAKSRKYARTKGSTKENAILFWPDVGNNRARQTQRKVLKVAVGDADHSNEIHMLEKVSSELELAPALLARDPDNKWLVMEFVENARPLSAPEQAEVYLDHIAKPYFSHFGTTSVPVANYLLETQISASNLQQCAKELRFNNIERLFSGHLTYSTTHGGGICEECLKTEEGKVYLLDWEKAGFHPIAEDLLQVFEHHPAKTLEVFDRFSGPKDLPPKDQLKLIMTRLYASVQAKAYPDKRRLAIIEKMAKAANS